MKQKVKDCPMCGQGWIDEDGNPVKPIRKRHNCEFCGSTGKMVVIDHEEIEGDEEDGRFLGRLRRSREHS